MIVTWAGNMRPISMTKNRLSRPGKLRRAKAKAASVHVSNWPTVTMTAISTLFI